MKSTILASFIMHISLFTIMFFVPTEKHQKSKLISVYQVELVSMPKQVEQTSTNVVVQSTAIKKEIVNISKTKIPEKKVDKIPPAHKQEFKPDKLQEQKPASNQGAGKINIDTRDFPYAYYLNILRYRIQENWQPPFQQTNSDDKLVAIVGFRVLRNGQIVDVKLENSSGRFLYDQAAQRAVYTASPLPPLPGDFPGEQLTVHIEFEELW